MKTKIILGAAMAAAALLGSACSSGGTSAGGANTNIANGLMLNMAHQDTRSTQYSLSIPSVGNADPSDSGQPKASFTFARGSGANAGNILVTYDEDINAATTGGNPQYVFADPTGIALSETIAMGTAGAGTGLIVANSAAITGINTNTGNLHLFGVLSDRDGTSPTIGSLHLLVSETAGGRTAEGTLPTSGTVMYAGRYFVAETGTLTIPSGSNIARAFREGIHRGTFDMSVNFGAAPGNDDNNAVTFSAQTGPGTFSDGDLGTDTLAGGAMVHEPEYRNITFTGSGPLQGIIMPDVAGSFFGTNAEQTIGKGVFRTGGNNERRFALGLIANRQ